MKRLNRRLKCFLLALLMAFDIPLIGYSTALAADAATYRTGLAPMEALVAAVVIGSGIVASQSQQAVNALVNSVCSIIKDNTVRKEEEDPAFESPYRVIQGGGDSGFDPTPEEPNNNNKNGRWFGVVGASALGSSLMFERGAVEDIMKTIQQQNGYNSTVSDIGIVSADDFKTQSTSGQIALQLANLGAPALGQFNAFLNSDFWENSEFDKNNCWFAVSCEVSSILDGNFPAMQIVIINKSDDVKFLRLKNRLTYYTFANKNGSLSYYGFLRGTSSSDNPNFLNEYEVNTPVRQQRVSITSRNSSTAFSYSASTPVTSQGVILGSAVNDVTMCAYCGYKWIHKNDWTFTNNVYNQNQTFNVNFPDWLQQSITLLGKQIDAVNLGLQNLSKINWATTQPQIQSAPASDAAVSQAINNWENPGNIPEPEPQPQPDPDPEPEPDPGDEPAHEDAVNDSAESVYDWVTQKITLPAGIFEKIPFSIPYDLYLLLRSMFPTSRVRKKAYLNVSNVQSRSGDSTVLDPNGITISSHFDAVAKNTRSYAIDWKPAPVINLDLHFAYSDVGGQKKTLDIVKTVDLQPYSYFAMIVYIFVYISWLGAVLGWILESFK